MIVAQPKEKIAMFVAQCVRGQHLPWGEYNALGNVRDGVLLAGVVYNHFSDHNVCMHVGAVGRYWLTPDFLHAAFDYPFNQLKVKRVTGLVPKKNKAARKLDENLGFTIEGNMRQALADDDMLLYGMTRSECRWLSAEFCERLAKWQARRQKPTLLAAA